MKNKKIIAVFLVVTVFIGAIFGYEFLANSLSGYTKLSLRSAQTYSVKFGSTTYYITYFYSYVHNGISSSRPVFQVTTVINNSIESFEARQGLRCSFSVLQMVVGDVNSNQMILYVSSTVSNSKPIISPSTVLTAPLPSPIQIY